MSGRPPPSPQTRPAMHRGIGYWMRWLWGFALAAAIAILVASLPGYLGPWAVAAPAAEQPSLAQAEAWLSIALSLSAALMSLTLAGLIFWRKSGEPMALFLSFVLLDYGAMLCGPLEALAAYWFPLVPNLGVQIQYLLLPVPMLGLMLVFPNGRFVPRWTLGLVPLIAVLSLLGVISRVEAARDLNTLPAQTADWVMLGVLFVILGLQAYRYRRLYTPVERQQTKWAVYGAVLWAVLLVLASIPDTFRQNLPPGAPLPWWASLAGPSWWLTLNILPLSLGLAITRSRLWEIDLLIRRTTTYSLLAALLAAVYYGSVVVLQRLFVAVAGQQSAAAVVLSTLAIAALFGPLRSRLQGAIDRRFYRRKVDAARTLAAFAQTARDETDLERLGVRLVEVVEDTMQPERVGLWLASPPTPALPPLGSLGGTGRATPREVPLSIAVGDGEGRSPKERGGRWVGGGK